jgi:hypothetical protein
MNITANVMVPELTSTPRGAELVGWLVDAGATLAAYVRARRAERGAATRYEDAEAVRRYARSVQNTDPGFAADLFAAADRHAC